MNWKLIFQLSLFGLAMSIATVFWIPSNIEPLFWLIIFIICAYVIARRCYNKYFLHGFMVSLVNSIWITTAHFIFYGTYISNHPEIAEMNRNMPASYDPKAMMVLLGPVFGACFGLVLGFFAFLASKFVKKTIPNH